jgi:hypothetical protein
MIGTKTDSKQRISLARIDSEDSREKVELARKSMFEEGVNITSATIEHLLQPTSLVATRVLLAIFFSFVITNPLYVECFLRALICSRFQFL